MKNNYNLAETQKNEKRGKILKYALIFSVFIFVYVINLMNVDVFDTSEVMVSHRTGIEKISREEFPKWIADKEIIEILVNDINKNSFKESKSYLQNPSYILFLEIERKEGNFTKIFHVSANLNDAGEMIIYDKLVGKYYKGKISKETVNKLDTIFDFK